MICYSIDLEYWNNSPLLKRKHSYRENIEEKIEQILEILKENNSKATFFVLGSLFEKNKRCVKKIAENGHEIAYHSYSHKLLFDENKKKYLDECKYWKEKIEDYTGIRIKGHRAPVWSYNKKNLWLPEVLKECGFEYDNSYHPYFFKKKRLVDKSNSLKQIPMPVLDLFNFKIPFSGSIFFRVLPLNILMKIIKKVEDEYGYVILYTHPWELFPPSRDIIKDTPFLFKKYNLSFTKNNINKTKNLLKKIKTHRIYELLKISNNK